MHEIHAPAFSGTGRDRGRPTMQGHVLPSTDPHAELQSIETREAADPLAIDQPPLTPEQYPDPQVAKSRSRRRAPVLSSCYSRRGHVGSIRYSGQINLDILLHGVRVIQDHLHRWVQRIEPLLQTLEAQHAFDATEGRPGPSALGWSGSIAATRSPTARYDSFRQETASGTVQTTRLHTSLAAWRRLLIGAALPVAHWMERINQIP